MQNPSFFGARKSWIMSLTRNVSNRLLETSALLILSSSLLRVKTSSMRILWHNMERNWEYGTLQTWITILQLLQSHPSLLRPAKYSVHAPEIPSWHQMPSRGPGVSPSTKSCQQTATHYINGWGLVKKIVNFGQNTRWVGPLGFTTEQHLVVELTTCYGVQFWCWLFFVRNWKHYKFLFSGTQFQKHVSGPMGH